MYTKRTMLYNILLSKVQNHTQPRRRRQLYSDQKSSDNIIIIILYYIDRD